jgi:uncharacterized membrane protein
MTADDSARQRRRMLRTQRLEAFSDGVFAIAITLLVLELSVPPDASDDLLHAFLHEWPSYLAYVVSFAAIGATWLAHTTITEYIDRTDTMLARLNLLLLLTVSFLPFPTRLVSEFVHERNAERVATTILGINLLLIATVTSLMWRYATRGQLVRADVDDEEVAVLTTHFRPGLAGYTLLIGTGIFVPRVAVFGYLAVALWLIIPVRLPRQRR